jgi:hypothetical protein
VQFEIDGWLLSRCVKAHEKVSQQMYSQYYFQAQPEQTTAALYLKSQQLGGSYCRVAVYPQPSGVMSCFSKY